MIVDSAAALEDPGCQRRKLLIPDLNRDVHEVGSRKHQLLVGVIEEATLIRDQDRVAHAAEIERAHDGTDGVHRDIDGDDASWFSLSSS